MVPNKIIKFKNHAEVRLDKGKLKDTAGNNYITEDSVQALIDTASANMATKSELEALITRVTTLENTLREHLTITFTVNGDSYSTIEGTTWRMLSLNSAGSEDGGILWNIESDDRVRYNQGAYIAKDINATSDSYVYADDLIIADYEYVTSA